MNAYYIQDRLEAQSWARHYQQIAREEKEAELADDMEKGLPQHLFESLCIDHLQRHGASKKAISLAQIGVRFVPIPVETDEEFHTLATSLSQKLEMMVAKAEADERDQV
ncbi:Host-nuclease inhibitor protein Gam [Escherichia coli]|nr:DUF1382 family protein [Escherichia coli]EFD6485290.1 DUF1382 family protein [Escherichia coli]EFO3466690.1 DUF1382 family protein [Escherichia coli]EFO3538454.1 DUF1382 family protein [Escherichia coli]EHV2503397.1 DUF1382 family protein [Escherichia coli]